MADASSHIDRVGAIVDTLMKNGFEPVLVGGMALVIIGSQRVTRDFDFVIAAPGERLPSLVDVFYDHGFELVSRFNDAREVAATIDNPRVAAIRLRSDAPDSAFFFHPHARLRIDLLFDFPIPAIELTAQASRMKIRSHLFSIASEADLLRLKTIARAHRTSARDAQDIEFLEARQARPPA